jgi:hypothetical protein
MKLNKKEKFLIKEYAKKLVKESIPDSPQFSKPFKNSREAILAIGDVLDGNMTEDEFIARLYGSRNIGNIDVKNFRLILGQLAMDARYNKFKLKPITQHVIDKNATKTNGTFNESKIIKENNNYTMISALREALDDLLMKTEMLIDEEYGKSSHKDFKRSWYNISETFEKTFKNIQRSLMVK